MKNQGVSWRRWSAMAVVALAGIFCSAAAGRTQPPALMQLWRQALQNNPAFQSQRLQVKEAEQQLQIQRRERLPKLSSSASYSYVSEVPELNLPFTLPRVSPVTIVAGTHLRYDLAATVEQPFFTGWRLKKQVQSAENGLAARSAELQARRNALLFQVGNLYDQILFNHLQEQTVEQAVARAELHLRRARVLLQAAQVTAFDTLEVANRRLQLVSQLDRLRDYRKVLLARLSRMVGGRRPALPDFGSLSPPRPQSVPPLDSLLAGAWKQRPELEALAASVKAQEARVGAIRSFYFPQIYGTFSYHYARPGVNFFRDEWMHYYTAGIGLKWNLWSWGQRKLRVQQAKLAVKKISLRRQDLVNQVEEEVKSAYYQLETLQDQLRLQERLVVQEQERYRLARTRYEQGQVSSLEFSDAEKSLLSAELTQKQLLVQWQIAWLRLQLATGDIGKVIGF